MQAMLGKEGVMLLKRDTSHASGSTIARLRLFSASLNSPAEVKLTGSVYVSR